MKRVYVLGAIVMAGALATAAADLVAQAPAGQAPAAPGAQGAPAPGPARGGRGPQPQISSIDKINDSLYFIQNQGGNTAVFITANGVVLVDTKNPNNGQAILDQVKTVTNKPVTHIINTHTHADHTGSNAFFPATVEIVTHENTAANMKKMKNFAEETTKQGLPDRTFKDKLTLLSGNDAIDLYYFGRAHTDGDTFVVFRNARVLHPGDAFASRAPGLIDAGNGGSGVEWGDTITKASKTITNVDTVIPSHVTGANVLLKWQDFVDWGEFNRLYVAHARESLKAGKTPEQAAMDFKPGDKFKDYTLTGGRGGAAGNFTAIYAELQGAAK
jgi:glyoxylase-like metal-dependent hydrolase (beta-lactamase superfamily II)